MLYDNSQTTIYRSVLAIMNFYIQHKLTRAALRDLLKILQVLLPKTNSMPKTDFQLFRMIDKAAPTCNFIKHYYCKKCLFYNNTNPVMEVCSSCLSTEGTSFFF